MLCLMGQQAGQIIIMFIFPVVHVGLHLCGSLFAFIAMIGPLHLVTAMSIPFHPSNQNYLDADRNYFRPSKQMDYREGLGDGR